MNDRITLRFLAAPGDAAADGTTVQAGSVLEWIDKAGYACAVGWAGNSYFSGAGASSSGWAMAWGRARR